MNLKMKQTAAVLCSTTLLLVGFQNCSPTNMKFSPSGQSGLTEGSSLGESGEVVGINPPSADVPEIPADPSGETPTTTEDHYTYNRITDVAQGGYLLSCGKTIKSITSIQRGAKVIFVNATLEHLTGLDRDADLILVNSQLKSVTGVLGNLITVEDPAEKQKWIDLCVAENHYAPVDASAPAYSTNTIDAEKAASVPRFAQSYQVTSIEADSGIESLSTTGLFGVTNLADKLSIKVKAKYVRLTSVSRGTRLILHGD